MNTPNLLVLKPRDRLLRKSLLENIKSYKKEQIEQSKKDKKDYELLYSKIEELSNDYAETLNQKIEARKEEMREDDNSQSYL